MRLRQLLQNGGTGQVIWAVTNVCNAKCAFCSYPRGKGGAPRYVDFPTARRVLDILYERNLRIISFTGGEPLLNPDIIDIITYAARRGFITRTGTNGHVLSPALIDRLRDTGLRNMWISLDSEDEDKHDKNRGIPGLSRHIRKMVPLLLRAGIKVNIAAPVNKLIGDFTAFADHVRGLGLDTIAFCYPMTAMAASYGGAADSDLVEFTPPELVRALTAIKALKRSGRVKVVNPTAGLEEMIRQQRGETSRFPCLGGYKFFYLDWNLTLYRCAFLSENYGSVLELGDRTFNPRQCHQCMWQCFRDPSVFYYLPLVLRRSADDGAWRRLGLSARQAAVSAAAWLELAHNGFFA